MGWGLGTCFLGVLGGSVASQHWVGVWFSQCSLCEKACLFSLKISD